MEIEVSKAPPYYQSQVSGRINSYKSDVISLKRAVEQHVSFGLMEEPFQQPLEGNSNPLEVIIILNTESVIIIILQLYKSASYSDYEVWEM